MIDLLLGMECIGILQLTYDREVGPGLSLFQSLVGQIVCGKNAQRKNVIASGLAEAAETNDKQLTKIVDRFFSNESCGLSEPVVNEEQRFMEEFEASIKFVPDPPDSEFPGRYEVQLPWKAEDIKLPTNYSLALKRMRSTVDKLRETPKQLLAYDLIMREQLQLGILERVDENEQGELGRVHYLAHQPVFKSSSASTKLRIVYDASAKASKQSVSLNECLYRGTVFAGQNERQIAALLMRFRLMDHVLIADLEKATSGLSSKG